MNKDLKALKRTERKEEDRTLFDIEPDWKDSWWGMPEFSNQDINPQSRITVSFITEQDRADFAQKLEVKLTSKTDSMWYPMQQRLTGGEYIYTGAPTDSKYPICILSKGRADCQTTGKELDKLGVNYHFFVEETEGDTYKEAIGEDKVIVMPFHDLGQGGIPARNFIWDWCREREYKRHWTVDDNIKRFGRTHMTRRLSVTGGAFFQAMEDFVDRYENIVMAGPHHVGFISVGWTNIAPYLLNSRVYSCILLKTDLPDRWRGRYNEDTDLSLRLLKQGYCTILFNALFMQKGATVGAGKAMKGGNTDNVYNTDDHRLAFAESLKKQHPDVVDVVWKFNRWHHSVNYTQFKKNKPILRKGVVPTKVNNEYGMELIRTTNKNIQKVIRKANA